MTAVKYEVGTPTYCDEHTVPRDVCGCPFEGDPAELLLSKVKSLADLDAVEFPPLRWAVSGLIPEGFGLLVGAPKLGKSWLALGVGLAIASGGVALGRIPVERRPVLYAALEDGERRLQDRARKLMAGQPLPASFDYVTESTPADIIPMIRAWLDLHPDGVVLLDTLGRVMPSASPGESSYQRDYRIGGALKSLTDQHPGATLLVVHHVRKMGSSDWMDSTSGTNGLNGAADFTVALERARGEGQGIIRVTGRDVREGSYAALIGDGAWTLDGADLNEAARAAGEMETKVGLGDDTAKVVAFVESHADGVNANQVATYMGWGDDKARVYLGRLTNNGRIARATRGIYKGVTNVMSVTFGPDVRPTSHESNTHNTSNTGGSNNVIDLWDRDSRGEQ